MRDSADIKPRFREPRPRWKIQAMGIALFLAAPVSASKSMEADSAVVRKVEKIIQIIKDNRPGGNSKSRLPKGAEKTFTLTEDEANAYIRYWIDKELNAGKRREVIFKLGTVRFKPGRILEAEAVAQIGVDSLKLLDSESESFFTKKLKQYLTVDNSLELQCLVSSANGKIFLKVQEAKIKSIPVPGTLVQQILQIVGKKQRPPIDFRKFFDLPNGIQKVEILPQICKLRIRGL